MQPLPNQLCNHCITLVQMMYVLIAHSLIIEERKVAHRQKFYFKVPDFEIYSLLHTIPSNCLTRSVPPYANIAQPRTLNARNCPASANLDAPGLGLGGRGVDKDRIVACAQLTRSDAPRSNVPTPSGKSASRAKGNY